MSYQIPKSDKPKSKMVRSVMFRLPVDLYEPFNKALNKSNLSAQLLIEDMVRHCLGVQK